MIKVDTNKDKKVLENLYKILRMNLFLKASQNKDQVLEEFKKVVKQLDDIEQENYENKMQELLYTALTLEEEEKRLTDILDLINSRIKQRKDLENDFVNVTDGYKPENLLPLPTSVEIEGYEKRLANIKEYLGNQKEIETTNQDLVNLQYDVEKNEKSKEECEEKNEKLEQDLLSAFLDIINNQEKYQNLKDIDIDIELDKLKEKVNETKNTKDVTLKCVEELEKNGVSGDVKQEYETYIKEAETNYYNYKEQEYLLKIYKLVASQELKYPNNFTKREDLKSLIEERKNLRSELKIEDKDILIPLEKIMDEQKVYIEAEKNIIENINQNNERIKFKQERLVKLEEDCKRVEILSLLKEFNLIDTYDGEEIGNDNFSLQNDLDNISQSQPSDNDLNIDFPVFENKTNYNKEAEKINVFSDLDINLDTALEEEKAYAPDELKAVEEIPVTMNFGLAKLKAISVMNRVGKMLINTQEVESTIKEPNLEKEEIPEVIPNENTLQMPVPEFHKLEPEINTDILNNQQNNMLDVAKQEDVVYAIGNQNMPLPEINIPTSNVPIFDNSMPIQPQIFVNTLDNANDSLSPVANIPTPNINDESVYNNNFSSLNQNQQVVYSNQNEQFNNNQNMVLENQPNITIEPPLTIIPDNGQTYFNQGGMQ